MFVILNEYLNNVCKLSFDVNEIEEVATFCFRFLVPHNTCNKTSCMRKKYSWCVPPRLYSYYWVCEWFKIRFILYIYTPSDVTFVTYIACFPLFALLPVRAGVGVVVMGVGW